MRYIDDEDIARMESDRRVKREAAEDAQKRHHEALDLLLSEFRSIKAKRMELSEQESHHSKPQTVKPSVVGILGN